MVHCEGFGCGCLGVLFRCCLVVLEMEWMDMFVFCVVKVDWFA